MENNNQQILEELIVRGSPITYIFQETNLPKWKIRKFIRETEKYNLWREKRFDNSKEVKIAISRGERSIEELAKIGNCKPNGFVRKYSKLIELPYDLQPYKWKPKIDILIDQGLTLEEIRDIDEKKVTIERVRQYITESYQHKLWEEGKDRRRELEKSDKAENTEIEKLYRQDLINFIYNYGKEKAKKQGFPYEKAWEYYFEILSFHTKRTQSFEELVNFYYKYEELVKNNIKFSYKSLAEELNLDAMGVYRKLKIINFNNNRKNSKLSKYIIEKINQARKIKMNSEDLSYFTKIKATTLRYKFGKRKNHYQINYGNKSGHTTNYRTMAQIYEAIDLGFTKDETIELLSLNEDIVGYGIKKRHNIEEKIVRDLRKLYKNPNIERAYQIN